MSERRPITYGKRVSIVIPCRNEERYIGKCLDSILSQDYPAELLEALVCDGRSTDGTMAVISAYSEKTARISAIINEQQTTSYGLNLGISKARGEVIIILGAHAELLPDYVSRCVEAFSYSDRTGCTGGILENVYENADAEVIGLAMSSGFGVGNAHFRTGNKEGSVDTVAFGAYKREVFEKAGLLDVELVRCQDDEFNFRVIRAGFEIVLSASIRCRYYVRASYRKLFRQYYQYGYWKVFVNRKHRTVTTARQLVPLLFVLYLAGGAVPGMIFPLLRPLYFGGIALYAAASLFSAARISRHAGQILPVMYSFWILHFSYGCGYFLGIVHFLLLRRSAKADDRSSR